MKTIDIYANYGLLAHEKQIIYSQAKGDIFDKVTVKLPEGWEPYQTVMGNIVLKSPWGTNYHIDEVIYSFRDDPWISAIDQNGNRYSYKLKVI